MLKIFWRKVFSKWVKKNLFFFYISLLQKVSERYRVELGPSADGSKLEVKSADPKIVKKTEEALHEVPAMLAEHGLQAARIQNLKMCTVPIWIFSSFALRNVINSDFHPSVSGGLWIPDMLSPDPYFILPVAVGVFGFLNLYVRSLPDFLIILCFNFSHNEKFTREFSKWRGNRSPMMQFLHSSQCLLSRLCRSCQRFVNLNSFLVKTVFPVYSDVLADRLHHRYGTSTAAPASEGQKSTGDQKAADRFSNTHPRSFENEKVLDILVPRQ